MSHFLSKKLWVLAFCCPIHIAAEESGCPVSEEESQNHFSLQCIWAFRKINQPFAWCYSVLSSSETAVWAYLLQEHFEMILSDLPVETFLGFQVVLWVTDRRCSTWSLDPPLQLWNSWAVVLFVVLFQISVKVFSRPDKIWWKILLLMVRC